MLSKRGCSQCGGDFQCENEYGFSSCADHGPALNECGCHDCLIYTERFQNPYITHEDCRAIGIYARDRIMQVIEKMGAK
jgi:hypothetical protein